MAGQNKAPSFQERNSKVTTCYSWPLIVGRPFSACQKKTSTQEGETGIIPPALEGLTELIEELHQGNPVDIDGDGFQELFYEELDEQINVYVDLPTGENVFFATLLQNGDLTALYDLDENEQADLEYIWTAATSTAIVYRDDDGDGYPEQRSTFVRDAATGTSHYQVEHDPEGSGEYTIIEKGDVPLQSHAVSMSSPKIPPVDLFFKPTSACARGTKEVFFGLPSVYICEGDGPKGCSPEESSMLKSAFACMFERYKTCMRDTNKSTWYSFLLHLALHGITGCVGIQCDSLENNTSATTNYYYEIFNSEIVFNRDQFGLQTEHDTCSVAIHEFMHALGEAVSKGGVNKEHDKGLDVVYACGRYCGFCSKYTKGTEWVFDSNNVECFVCADSAERKKACGFREELVTGRCHENYSVCHAGLSCLMSPCEKCGESAIAKSCHQNPENQKEFDWRNVGSWCCQECPATCNNSNDMPCSEVYIDPNLQDTCSQPPPYCSSTHGAD